MPKLIKWVKYYHWEYLVYRELGWIQVDQQPIASRTALGEQELWVKMQPPEGEHGLPSARADRALRGR